MADTLPLLSGVEIEALLVRKAKHRKEAETEGNDLAYLCRKFHKAGLNVQDQTGKSRTEYLAWQLTWDGSIYHPQEGVDARRDSWFGVELVSPPLPAFKPSTPPQLQEHFEDIRQYVEVLSGDKSASKEYSSSSSTEDNCGLHVHFGLPDKAPIALPILKCLALLLVVYEPTIIALHHGQRTPYPGTKSSYANSNLIGLQQDKHTCHGLISWASVKKRIFDAPSISALAALMGSSRSMDDGYDYAVEDWEDVAKQIPLPGDELP